MMQSVAGRVEAVVVAMRRFFGRGLHTEALLVRQRKKSIAIRHLDGGSSNVAELELAALTNPIYDLTQYGIHFVASPRHADLLLVTGPLTWNMLGPACKTFSVMPDPKWIVTIGDFADFAAAGGIPQDPELAALFDDSYAITRLPDEMREAIIAHIPGDPPNPETIVSRLLSHEVDLWNPTRLCSRGALQPHERDGHQHEEEDRYSPSA